MIAFVAEVVAIYLGIGLTVAIIANIVSLRDRRAGLTSFHFVVILILWLPAAVVKLTAYVALLTVKIMEKIFK